jgi:hypothetical protein
MADVYVAVDIEADGPIPGVNSMMSIGAAAFRAPSPGISIYECRKPISGFEANLAPLEGATPDPGTMAWWNSQDPEVLEYVTKGQRPAEEVMVEFVKWLDELPGKPVMVTYPSWDYMWVYWYTMRFTGKRPFGLGCLDMKSMAFGVRDIRAFSKSVKRNYPKKWMSGLPKHNHTALQDATGQGIMFVNMMYDINGF